MEVYQKRATTENFSQHNRATQLRAALAYGRRDIPVFPCEGKAPLTPHGFKDASSDRTRIHMQWTRHPDANIAIPTGGMSGLVVVDKDGPSPEAEKVWNGLPPTLEVETSRGRHRYYRVPVGTRVRTRKLAPDLDLKADGGYIMAPPSIHPNGTPYRFVEETKALGIAELPEGLVRDPRASGKPSGGSRASQGVCNFEVADSGPIPEGVRNGTLFFLALDLKDKGQTREEAHVELLNINDARCEPPLPEAEVGAIVRSAFRYPIRGQRVPPEVREMLATLKRAWWTTPWRGVGGKSERDVLRVLIEWGERYGLLIEAGVRISISWRDVALASGCGLRTVGRVVKRLKVAGWLRGDNDMRSGTDSGAFVLLPRPTDTTQSRVGLRAHTECSSGVTLARLPEKTPCWRWRGLVGKGKAGALYALEVFGEQGLEELAERLGFKRPRDLRRKYLEPLAELGLIEDMGGVYRLAADYSEVVHATKQARYGGGPRKVRAKDPHGQWVSRVVEVPATSEAEREAADRLEYERQRERYRDRLNRQDGHVTLHLANANADGFTGDLEPVPDVSGALRDALKAFLSRNPHRKGEHPGWLSVALWSEGYTSGPQAPPLAVEAALVEIAMGAA